MNTCVHCQHFIRLKNKKIETAIRELLNDRKYERKKQKLKRKQQKS